MERTGGHDDGNDPSGTLVRRLAELNEVGIALSREKNLDHLLEAILVAAKKLTAADGGTLYRLHRSDRDALHFEILRNDSLGISLGGTTGKKVHLDPVPLRDAAGRENTSTVAAYAVLRDRTVNIADAYQEKGFDFSGTKAFDKQTGYRSQSFLTVPMKNHEGEIIGVLQLINAKDASGAIVPFDATAERLAQSLASQAAVALTNRLLILQLEHLFESFISMINQAIDDKSPYTGGHCARVPVLTMLLAEAAHRTSAGPLSSWRMSDQDRYELKIAALLHDCGKIVTPVHVVDKATKLQTIHDRIELVDARLDVVRRDIEIAYLRACAQPGADEAALDQAREEQLQTLEADRKFLHEANLGSEAMSPEHQERVREISRRHVWRSPSGEVNELLTPDELRNLTIRYGTLTPEERQIINHHVEVTIRMLESLSWPKHLRNVPEYAGGHHERMDGKGYPRGLTGDQMSIPARMMGIADIFEALTASDRPYKKGKTLTDSLRILGQMSLDGHVDPELFQIFVRERVYLRYGEQYLDPAQIDDVDLKKIPGYRGE